MTPEPLVFGRAAEGNSPAAAFGRTRPMPPSHTLANVATGDLILLLALDGARA